MQIISGKFRGRKLFSPKGLSTRPTNSKTREAIFNICQNEIEDSFFLDLFAGSGAMGFEALSRGAEFVAFVEKNLNALSCIQKNKDFLKIPDEKISILSQDAERAIHYLKEKKKQFDLIYMDPPYYKKGEKDPLSLKILNVLAKASLLKTEGRLFLEESKEFSSLELDFFPFQLEKKRDMGKTTIFQFILS